MNNTNFKMTKINNYDLAICYPDAEVFKNIELGDFEVDILRSLEALPDFKEFLNIKYKSENDVFLGPVTECDTDRKLSLGGEFQVPIKGFRMHISWNPGHYTAVLMPLIENKELDAIFEIDDNYCKLMAVSYMSAFNCLFADNQTYLGREMDFIRNYPKENWDKTFYSVADNLLLARLSQSKGKPSRDCDRFIIAEQLFFLRRRYYLAYPSLETFNLFRYAFEDVYKSSRKADEPEKVYKLSKAYNDALSLGLLDEEALMSIHRDKLYLPLFDRCTDLESDLKPEEALRDINNKWKYYVPLLKGKRGMFIDQMCDVLMFILSFYNEKDVNITLFLQKTISDFESYVCITFKDDLPEILYNMLYENEVANSIRSFDYMAYFRNDSNFKK